jgi:hypothetical protein
MLDMWVEGKWIKAFGKWQKKAEYGKKRRSIKRWANNHRQARNLEIT